MAIQLSQEQCLSDSNIQELDKLKTSLEISKATIKSLKSRNKDVIVTDSSMQTMAQQIDDKLQNKELKILIESQNKIFQKCNL